MKPPGVFIFIDKTYFSQVESFHTRSVIIANLRYRVIKAIDLVTEAI